MLSRLRLPTSRLWNSTIALRDRVKDILRSSVGQRSIAASWTIANLRTPQNVTPQYIKPPAFQGYRFEKIGDSFIAGGPRSLVLMPNHNTCGMNKSDEIRSPVIIPVSFSAYKDLLEIQRDEIEFRIDDFMNIQDPYNKADLYHELHEEKEKLIEEEKHGHDSSGPIMWNLV